MEDVMREIDRAKELISGVIVALTSDEFMLMAAEYYRKHGEFTGPSVNLEELRAFVSQKH
jgi:hypothetical protein